MFYEIGVQGMRDESWSEWLGSLDVGPLDSGDAVLTGPIQNAKTPDTRFVEGRSAIICVCQHFVAQYIWNRSGK